MNLNLGAVLVKKDLQGIKKREIKNTKRNFWN